MEDCYNAIPSHQELAGTVVNQWPSIRDNSQAILDPNFIAQSNKWRVYTRTSGPQPMYEYKFRCPLLRFMDCPSGTCDTTEANLLTLGGAYSACLTKLSQWNTANNAARKCQPSSNGPINETCFFETVFKPNSTARGFIDNDVVCEIFTGTTLYY